MIPDWDVGQALCGAALVYNYNVMSCCCVSSESYWLSVFISMLEPIKGVWSVEKQHVEYVIFIS